MWKIPLYKSDFGDREKDALIDVLNASWYTMGPKTAGFEKEFETYLQNGLENNVYCTAVSSGTAALHIALMLLDLNSTDEVIIPSLTFVANLNVVQLCGAKAVVADSASLDDWNMSPEKVESLITENTKAIVAVHYAGYPVSLQIKDIATKHGLALIEDTAHAIGASVNSQKCGTFGNMAAFSFFANKNLAVGEGGMFVTSDESMYERSKLLRSHGMSTSSRERHYGANPSYDILQPGLNYRIDEFRSALGLVQLEKLDANNESRRKITEYYISRLKNSPLTIPFVKIASSVKPSYHIFPILLPQKVDRAVFMDALKAEGIQASIHYPSYRQFSYYKDIIDQKTPISDEISNRVVTLPLYPTMTEDEAEQVVKAVLSNIT
ncbi:MAG: DegT/DnrJ/EryC1/StrS family aminotransferase [Leptospirales bacterium]